MVIRKTTNNDLQTITQKTKGWTNQTPLKPGMNSCALEGLDVAWLDPQIHNLVHYTSNFNQFWVISHFEEKTITKVVSYCRYLHVCQFRCDKLCCGKFRCSKFHWDKFPCGKFHCDIGWDHNYWRKYTPTQMLYQLLNWQKMGEISTNWF